MASEEKFDVYAKVTEQIVAAIEAGVGTWKMPWHTIADAAFSPINAISRKAYRGINTICLWAAAQAKGYTSGEWATYKQWQERGAQVRKGEKSTLVVFWKFANVAEEVESDDESPSYGSRLLFTRGYHVFNASQVDGYTPKAVAPLPERERDGKADQFFAAIGADVRIGGNRAFYSPATDHIQMPAIGQFQDSAYYYSTLAHEHGHWTGVKARLDREMGKRFGDMAYAAEELVAELTAAYTCSHLGVSSTPREDHAQYIAHWLKVLKADKRAIFTAASKAQAAADFLVKRSTEGAQAPAVGKAA